MKWVIFVKLPSGNRYAWARAPKHPKDFALAPIVDGAVHNALSWDTEDDARTYMAEQLRVAPDLERMGELTVEQLELPQ